MAPRTSVMERHREAAALRRAAQEHMDEEGLTAPDPDNGEEGPQFCPHCHESLRIVFSPEVWPPTARPPDLGEHMCDPDRLAKMERLEAQTLPPGETVASMAEKREREARAEATEIPQVAPLDGDTEVV